MTNPFLVSLGFVTLFLWAGCATTPKEDGPNVPGESNETSSLLPDGAPFGKGGKRKPGKPSGSPATQPSDNEASPVASGSSIPGPSKKEKVPALTGEGSSGLELPKDELAEGPDISTDPVQEEPRDFAEGAPSSKANEGPPLEETVKNDPDQAPPSPPPLTEKGPEALGPGVDKIVSGEPNPLPGTPSVPEAGPSVDSFFKPVPPVTDLPGANGIPSHDQPSGGIPPVTRDPSEPVSSNDPGDDSSLPSDSEPSVEVPGATASRNLGQGDSSVVLRPSATDDDADTVTRGIHLLDTAPETQSVLAPSSNGRRLSLSRNLGAVDIPGINHGKAVGFSSQALQAGNSAGNEAVPRVGFLDPSGKTVGPDEAGKTIGFSDEKNSPGLIRPLSRKDLDGMPLNLGDDSRPTYDSLRRLLDAGKKGEAGISPNERKVRDFSGIEELLKARAGGGGESPSGLEKDAQDGARYQNALQWLRSRGLTENGKNVD